MAINCNTVRVDTSFGCQCTLNTSHLDEWKIHDAVYISNKCINLTFGCNLTSHEIYEHCDSNNNPDITTYIFNMHDKD